MVPVLLSSDFSVGAAPPFKPVLCLTICYPSIPHARSFDRGSCAPCPLARAAVSHSASKKHNVCTRNDNYGKCLNSVSFIVLYYCIHFSTIFNGLKRIIIYISTLTMSIQFKIWYREFIIFYEGDNMKEILEEVLMKYGSEKNNDFANNSHANYIRQDIPRYIFSELRPNYKQYKITASPGQGNWASVPWIGLFDLDITDTASNGLEFGH